MHVTAAATVCIDNRDRCLTANEGNNANGMRTDKADVSQEHNRQVPKCGQHLNDGDVKLDCGCADVSFQ
jgi:hypothetical protein